MLRGVVMLVAVLVAGISVAQEAAGGAAARLRLLDKHTNRLRDVTLPVGSLSANLPLQVRVRACARDVEGVPGQDVAWLDVLGLDGAPVFSGWMFNLYPDVAALEHARYDVRLLECARSAKAGPVAVPAGDKAAKDVGEVKGVDSEAPAGKTAAGEPKAPAIEEPAADPLHDLMDEATE